MATQQTRTPSSETLPAIRPASPLGSLRQSTKSMHESMILPPIQSLTREFPSRLEHTHSEPNLGQRSSPPDPNGYHRKRAATGEVTGNLSPPSASKRRRLESTESNGASAELATMSVNANSSTGPAHSHSPSMRHHHGHSRQASGVDSHHLTPPTPPNNASLQPSRAPPSHEHRRTTSTSGMYATATAAPLKQEQISPPAVVVQSPATPSTLPPSASSNSAAWQSESASFSRRISNASASSSSLRPTGRKQPPSRLNFQPHHGHKSSLEANIAPSIRSAPPVPVPQGQMIPPRPVQPAGGSWISSRVSSSSSSSQLRSSHNHHHHPAADTPDLTPRANKNSEAWPSIPTPTSLRLSHSIVPPPVPPSNPNLTGARSPSARLPITPAVPSPIPTLGASTGSVADKARFMAKMSEIYDRTNVHKQCISPEDIDRRIKDVLASRDHEIVQLKKEVAELRKLLRGPAPPGVGAVSVDQDGDVAMAQPPNHLQPTAREASTEAPASRAMTVSPSPQPGDARKDGAVGQIAEEVAQSLAAPNTPATLNGKPPAGTADAETTMTAADAATPAAAVTATATAAKQ